MQVTSLARLSALLDQALDLDAPGREAWLSVLTDGADAPLVPTLRRMLAHRDAPETDDLLSRGPAFAIGDDRTLAPGTTVGPYRLLAELGSGGMGSVWLAERADGSLKRKVALKLPHVGWTSGLAERFAREREILSALEHPHIARLYDAGVDGDGRPYMALEYVEGQPIDAYCEGRQLSLEGRLGLLLQVAEAVAFAHSRLVVHRDLKPGNILVTAEGQVRLLDFGIAKLIEGEAARETALTLASGRALTLDYASPEQIRGEPIGTPSDVYSLGVVAFELLTGERPYRLRYRSAAQLEEAITQLDAPLASSLARDPQTRRRLRGELDAILNKALKKSTADRYPTVDALAQDWQHHLAGRRVFARPDTLAYRASRVLRRHRVPLAAGVVAVAAFGLALGAGATALVIGVLLAGLAASLWQARRAAQARDRALVLLERNEAATEFLNMMLTQTAQGGQALTPQQLLEKAEQLVEQEFKHHPEQRAMVLAMIGTNAQTLGQLGRALPLLERALATLRDSRDRDLLDMVTLQHAFAIGWAGRFDEARASLKAVVARESTQPEQRAEGHHYLALIASRLEDAPAALENAAEALRWHRRSRRSSPRLAASLLGSLGAACSLAGRVAEADRHFAEAAARLESIGMAGGTHAVALFNNWAVISERAGDATRALEVCDRAAAAIAHSGAPASPYVVFNRARALDALGRLDEAEAGYREAFEMGRSSGNAAVMTVTRLGLAMLATARGDVAAAATLLDEAADAQGPMAVTRQIALGRLALVRGEPGVALPLFTAALGNRPPLPTTLNALLGRTLAYLHRDELDAALADAADAVALAERLQGGKPSSFRSGLALLQRAQVHARRGETAEAVRDAGLAQAQLRAAVDPRHRALSEVAALLP